MSFFTELRQRKVFQVAAGYLALAWVLVQVGDVALGAFQAPAWMLQTLILLCGLGFPVALLLAWAVELTPDGVKLDGRKGGSKLMLAISASLFLLVLGWHFHDGLRPVTHAAQAPAAPAGDERSIAVLPFVSLDKTESDGYFADGLTEETINSLTNLEGMRVIGRTSSFYYKNRNIDLRTIGQQLDASHLIEGSVRRSGDTLRITVQLIEAANGSHLWSQTFDRKDTDPFTVQTEIANAVARQFELRLLPVGDAVLDGAAQREYLQLLARARERGDYAAINELRIFLRAHPRYRPGYLALGDLLSVQASIDTKGMNDLLALVEEVQQRWPGSIEAQVLAALPDIANGFYRPFPSQALNRQLAALRPLADRAGNIPLLQSSAGWTALLLDQPDVATRYFERQVALEPQNPSAHIALVQALLYSGRLDRAKAAARHIVELQPTGFAGYRLLGWMDVAERDYDGFLDDIAACGKTPDWSNCAYDLQNFFREFRQDPLADQTASLYVPKESIDWEAKLMAVHRAGGYPELRVLMASRGENARMLEPNLALLAISAFDSGRDEAALTALQSLSPDISTSGGPLLTRDHQYAILAGIALHRLGRTGEARALFGRVLAGAQAPFERWPPSAVYGTVCALAWLGREDEAVLALRRAIESGWHDERSLLEWRDDKSMAEWPGIENPGVDPLRGNADFRGLMAQVRERHVSDFAKLKARNQPLIPLPRSADAEILHP